ncbi:MAG: thiamine phosphate synthase [Verrucomicrobia bacterium]|nr:thiamine phosphate synthase [Verrucomicrobiota bacterium]
MPPALDPARARFALLQARLYAILDASYAPPSSWPALATQLADGGAGIFQLRAKNLPKDQILTSAKILAPLLAQQGIPLILNDYPDLVVPSGAAGCHLGQDDLGIPEARRLLGPSVLLGLSTHSPCQAEAGQALGADYLGFGPLYATGTKPDYPPIGPSKIREIVGKVTLPFFCIGGLNPERVTEAASLGASRVCVVSHLLLSQHPADAAREILSRLGTKASFKDAGHP